VLRWSATVWRRMEKLRDQLLRGVGTDEPWFLDEEFLHDYLNSARAAHWRKPLRIDEVNRLAPTPEVKARTGRA